MKRLGLKYGRVSQEILVNKKSGCPSHTTQLHTAYYWPITMLLLLLVLDNVEWYAVVEEKKAQMPNGLLLDCLPSSRPTAAD